MSGREKSDVAGCWTLEGTTARLACGGLAGAVDLHDPQRGLHALRHNGQALDGWLIGVTAEAVGGDGGQAAAASQPWAPGDVYVRGCDLVASYPEAAGRPFSLHVYWRVRERSDQHVHADVDMAHAGMGPVVDAIVSVQTRAWEAFPEVSVCSALATEAVEVVRGDDAHVIGVALRPAGVAWSFVESSPAGDFVAAQVAVVEGGLRCVSWKYGRQFMERGVIRRLRLRGAIVERQDDEGAVRRLRDELAAEEPPLTA